MGLFSKGLKNEFETAVVNDPSVFEPLKFYFMSAKVLYVHFSVIFTICVSLSSPVGEIIMHFCLTFLILFRCHCRHKLRVKFSHVALLYDNAQTRVET